MNNNQITKYESKAQKIRAKRGSDFESLILRKSSIDWTDEINPIQDKHTSKYWLADSVNHNHKIFLELTTSVKDTKESKIIIESETYKYHYPDYTFVVGIKRASNPRKHDGEDSFIDHLKQTPTIDQVLIGEEEILKFMDKPYYNKQSTINNKNTGDNMLENTSKLVMDTLLYGASKGDSNGVNNLIKMLEPNANRITKTKEKSKTPLKAKARKREEFRNSLLQGVKPTEAVMTLGELVRQNWTNPKSGAELFFSSKKATQMLDDGVQLYGMSYDRPSKWRIKKSDVGKYFAKEILMEETISV